MYEFCIGVKEGYGTVRDIIVHADTLKEAIRRAEDRIFGTAVFAVCEGLNIDYDDLTKVEVN